MIVEIALSGYEIESYDAADLSGVGLADYLRVQSLRQKHGFCVPFELKAVSCPGRRRHGTNDLNFVEFAGPIPGSVLNLKPGHNSLLILELDDVRRV